MSKLSVIAALALTSSLAFAEEGLKTVNYADATADSKSEGAPALSAEQAEKVKADVEAFKKKQEESQKALKELDEEDAQE